MLYEVITRPDIGISKKESEVKQQKSKTELNKSIDNPQNTVINALKKAAKAGASLKDLAKIMDMDQAKTRVILKELLDKDIVEKIQQKYYII